ncbi:MAG: universal stress protein [Acidobacteria bacterium]|nr:universal stress protein [Acidobacteriota bacterium]
MIRKILFSTNFTPLSRKALDYTLELAKKTGAKILGAYVLKFPMPVYSLFPPPPRHRSELEAISRAKLQAFFQGPGLENVEIETRLSLGSPEQELNKLATRERADLIVVGKHSRSTLERFFIASTTEKILRETRKPVLVLPDAAAGSVRWKPVVCAVDFSNASLQGLKFAIELARDYRVDLRVIHVLELGPAVEALGEETRVHLASVPARVKSKLDAVVATFGAPRETTTAVVQGKPSEMIVEEAARARSDLLVVGRRGNTSLDRASIGSTTSAVLRAAYLPVLVVPGTRARSSPAATAA